MKRTAFLLLIILTTPHTALGVAISSPEALNNNALVDTNDDQMPAVVTDGLGNWVAVWRSSDDLGGSIGTDDDILFARSVNNGVTWTDPEPVMCRN